MPDTNNLEEKLNCVFADVGNQIGALIKALVDKEIQSHLQRIEDLKNVLDPNRDQV